MIVGAVPARTPVQSGRAGGGRICAAVPACVILHGRFPPGVSRARPAAVHHLRIRHVHHARTQQRDADRVGRDLRLPAHACRTCSASSFGFVVQLLAVCAGLSALFSRWPVLQTLLQLGRSRVPGVPGLAPAAQRRLGGRRHEPPGQVLRGRPVPVPESEGMGHVDHLRDAVPAAGARRIAARRLHGHRHGGRGRSVHGRLGAVRQLAEELPRRAAACAWYSTR